jgi:hypothetical protein
MNRSFFALFIFIGCAFFSPALYAGGGDGDSRVIGVAAGLRTSHTVKEVTRQITYPAGIKAKHATEIVLVSFRTEPCGWVTILETNASNPEFETFVVNKLEALRITHIDDQVHHVRFSFKSAAHQP